MKMDIGNIRQKKTETERAIKDLINRFCDQTGCKVDGIIVDRDCLMDSSGKEICGEYSVRIEALI